MFNFNDYLDTVLRISLTIALSSIVGLEREIRNKGAGLRTHILVGVGSTLLVLTSIHISEMYSKITPADPTRMIAGLITGIGFLCGGTIIQSESTVRGLTSAATLWIVSGIGIAVGVGDYTSAIVVAVVTFFVLTVLRAVEFKIADHFNKNNSSPEKDETEGGK